MPFLLTVVYGSIRLSDKLIVLKPRQAGAPYRHPNGDDGRRLRSQTRDLYRVKSVFNQLKLFGSVAFPVPCAVKAARNTLFLLTSC